MWVLEWWNVLETKQPWKESSNCFNIPTTFFSYCFLMFVVWVIICWEGDLMEFLLNYCGWSAEEKDWIFVKLHCFFFIFIPLHFDCNFPHLCITAPYKSTMRLLWFICLVDIHFARDLWIIFYCLLTYIFMRR